MTNENQVEILNGLIENNYDAENGYKNAAENVSSPQFKSIFEEYAQQRYDFGHEIKDEIRQLGGTVDKGGSVTASLHRTWIDLKSAIASDEDEAVLREVVRGEEKAVDVYQSAIDQLPIGSSAVAVLTRQRNAIRAAKERMERLYEVADA